MADFEKVIPKWNRVCADCVNFDREEGVCFNLEDEYGDPLTVEPSESCEDYEPTIAAELLFLRDEAEKAEKIRRSISLNATKKIIKKS